MWPIALYHQVKHTCAVVQDGLFEIGIKDRRRQPRRTGETCIWLNQTLDDDVCICKSNGSFLDRKGKREETWKAEDDPWRLSSSLPCSLISWPSLWYCHCSRPCWSTTESMTREDCTPIWSQKSKASNRSWGHRRSLMQSSLVALSGHYSLFSRYCDERGRSVSIKFDRYLISVCGLSNHRRYERSVRTETDALAFDCRNCSVLWTLVRLPRCLKLINHYFCFDILIRTMAGSFSVFILARVVGGLSKGNVSLATAVVTDDSTPKTRGRGMALIGIAFSIGFLIGPIIGAIFSRWAKERSGQWFVYPALFALSLSIVDFAFIFAYFEETLPAKQRLKSFSAALNQAALYINPVSLFNFASLKNLSAADKTSLRTIGRVYFLYLFLYSGLEFTLTFLTHIRFNFTSMQQVRSSCDVELMFEHWVISSSYREWCFSSSESWWPLSKEAMLDESQQAKKRPWPWEAFCSSFRPLPSSALPTISGCST